MKKKLCFAKTIEFIKSMRFALFAAIALLVIVPTIIVGTIFINVATKKFYNSRVEQFSVNNTMLKNNIISSANLSDDLSDEVKSQINVIAHEYNCRVEIIDAYYFVRFDTNSLGIGATNISTAVLNAMKGKEVVESNSEKNYVQYAVPLVSVASGVDNVREKRVVGVLCLNYSTKSVVDYRKQVRRIVWAGESIVGFFALILAWIISALFMRPIRKIDDSIKKISVEEDYEEIDSINSFVEAEEIVDEFNSIIKDYSIQKQKRNEFVSNVSHELKTPITSMKVLADSLVGQSGMPEEIYQEFLQDISKEIDRENKIIVDLLGLINIEKTSNALNISPVNITEVLESLLKMMKPLAEQKNIEIVYECLENVIADVDEQKMSSVFTNLVENAIKYNQVDGKVTVNLNADHQYFYLKVTDTGIGIAEEDQERVFERFFRVDKARARETGGTGLGLAITKEIIKKHQGSIEVFSREGEGTTFTVRIPLKYIEE